MAFIDDSLSRQKLIKDQILSLVKTLNNRLGEGPDLGHIHKTIEAIDGFEPEILLEVYLEADSSLDNSLLLLLEGIGPASILKKIDYFLSNPRMPVSQQRKLLLLKALLIQKSGNWNAWLEKSSTEDFLEVSSKLWECLEPEELGMIWLQDYFSLPPEEKIPILRLFCNAQKPCYLGILALEAQEGTTQIQELLVKHLHNWWTLDIFPILKRLQRSKSPQVASLAIQVLKRLLDNGPDNLKSGYLYSRYQSYKCYLGEYGTQGLRFVLYSMVNENELVKSIMLKLSQQEGLIQQCIAEVRPSPESFYELMDDLQGTYSDTFFEEVTPDQVIHEIFDAEERSLRRGYRIPLDYWVWSILIPPRVTPL